MLNSRFSRVSSDQLLSEWTQCDSQTKESPKVFAVGTPVARRLSQRSEQAQFTHSAPTSGV